MARPKSLHKNQQITRTIVAGSCFYVFGNAETGFPRTVARGLPNFIALHELILSLICRTNQTQLKRIFFYTKYFRKEPSFNLGMGSEQFETCKFKNCFTTNNKQFLNSLDKFDAVLFHPCMYFLLVALNK